MHVSSSFLFRHRVWNVQPIVEALPKASNKWGTCLHSCENISLQALFCVAYAVGRDNAPWRAVPASISWLYHGRKASCPAEELLNDAHSVVCRCTYHIHCVCNVVRRICPGHLCWGQRTDWVATDFTHHHVAGYHLLCSSIMEGIQGLSTQGCWYLSRHCCLSNGNCLARQCQRTPQFSCTNR